MKALKNNHETVQEIERILFDASDGKYFQFRTTDRLEEEGKKYNESKTTILKKIRKGIDAERYNKIRSSLDADMWTLTCERPLKFFIACKKACYICRGEITTGTITGKDGSEEVSKP